MDLKKVDWTKYIGYILFVATVVTWIFMAGKTSGRIERLNDAQTEMNIKLDKQQDLLMKQQEINGKFITFIDIQLNQNNNEND